MATAMARVGANLKLRKRTVSVFEGDIVEGLHYQVGNEILSVSGCVRVIVTDTKANNQIVDSCPPEPYVQNFMTPRMLIIDSSDTYDADMIRVNISAITDIDRINGITDPDAMIDHAIETKIPESTVVEEADNLYSITVGLGTVSTGGLWEEILKVPGIQTISCECNGITHVYHKGDDIEAYKKLVDEFIPKSNDDPEVTITMTVYIINE